MKKGLLAFVLTFVSLLVSANEMYRAPSAGDSGSYFVISSEQGDDGIHTVLTSRIGKGNAYTDFTKLKINCASKQYFELGGSSEDGAKNSPSKPLKDWSNSKWTPIVSGSSKSDLVRYICE